MQIVTNNRARSYIAMNYKNECIKCFKSYKIVLFLMVIVIIGLIARKYVRDNYCDHSHDDLISVLK